MSTFTKRTLRSHRKHLPSRSPTFLRFTKPQTWDTQTDPWSDQSLSNAAEHLHQPTLSEQEFDKLSPTQVIDLYSSSRLTPSAPTLDTSDTSTTLSHSRHFLSDNNIHSKHTVTNIGNQDGSVKAFHIDFKQPQRRFHSHTSLDDAHLDFFADLRRHQKAAEQQPATLHLNVPSAFPSTHEERLSAPPPSEPLDDDLGVISPPPEQSTTTDVELNIASVSVATGTTQPTQSVTGWQIVTDTAGRTRHASAPTPHPYGEGKHLRATQQPTIAVSTTTTPTTTTTVTAHGDRTGTTLTTDAAQFGINQVTQTTTTDSAQVNTYNTTNTTTAVITTTPLTFDYDSDDMADSLLPKGFHGRRDESAIEWLQDIELYVQFKRLNAEAKLGLIALKLQAGARTWWDRLPAGVRTDFDQFKAQFLQKFKLDEETKIKASADVWINKQGKRQSVDDYIDSVERAAIKGDFTQEQLCFCLKNGFQTRIRKALTGKDLHTVDDIRRAARAVEALDDDSDDENSSKSLAQEVQRLVLELKGPKTRQIQSRSPSPKVRFDEHSISNQTDHRPPDIGRDGPISETHSRWSNNQTRSTEPDTRNTNYKFQRGKGTWHTPGVNSKSRDAHLQERSQRSSTPQPTHKMPPWRANENTSQRISAPQPLLYS